MTKAVPRNSPSPCGSGKKYKKCCFLTDRKVLDSEKIDAKFNVNGVDSKRKISSLDSIPTHNQNGLISNITKSKEIQLLLDLAEIELKYRKVDMLADITNRLVEEMNIVPQFTYRDVGMAIDKDSRFEHCQMQVVSLSGTDPMDLLMNQMEK